MRISIEGNIGAGKSCILERLAGDIDTPVFPEPVDEWKELLGLYYAAPREFSLAFNMKVLLSFRDPGSVTPCVVERSPLSCRHVFGQLVYNEGLMAQQEWDLFKEYSDIFGWSPDILIYIDTPAEVCFERIRRRAREGESKIDLTYVKRVEFQYANMLKYTDVPVVHIDGARDPAEVYADVLQVVRQHLSIQSNV